MKRWIQILMNWYWQFRISRQMRFLGALAKKSIGFRTKVLEIVREQRLVNDYVLLCIRTRLRVNGKIVCRKVHTLVKGENLVHAGERVLVRYQPKHAGMVLLMQA